MKIPNNAQTIISKLQENGFKAYVVGGCVRDTLMGKIPRDWDICTSALPTQIKDSLKAYEMIDTGIKHGTITVVMPNFESYEVTTFRLEDNYEDNRHPSKVEFITDLSRDVSRRDFTINAMAFNKDQGIVDMYNGVGDIKSKIIKCVGDPDQRFREDALRIIRAVRFASETGFKIDGNTYESMVRNKELLHNISKERLCSEIKKIVLGDKAGYTILRYIQVILEVIPELGDMVGFEQNNPYHIYDVLTHTALAIDSSPKELELRLAMLLHDVGKPASYTEVDGLGHFYGHAKISEELAHRILKRLRFSNECINTVRELVLNHSSDFKPRKKHLKRWLNKLGEQRVLQLIEVKKADIKSQSAMSQEIKTKELIEAEKIVHEIIAERQCFSVKDLYINGHDLIAIGLQGKDIGSTLNKLLEMVMDEEIENEKDKLLSSAIKIKANMQ